GRRALEGVPPASRRAASRSPALHYPYRKNPERAMQNRGYFVAPARPERPASEEKPRRPATVRRDRPRSMMPFSLNKNMSHGVARQYDARRPMRCPGAGLAGGARDDGLFDHGGAAALQSRSRSGRGPTP